MKRQPKPHYRTRVDSLLVHVRYMRLAKNLNGIEVRVRRYGVDSNIDECHIYKHPTDASMLRIARVGRAITAQAVNHDAR